MKKLSFSSLRSVHLPTSWMKKIKQLPLTLGKNAFITILILLLMELVLGEVLFYRFVIQVLIEQPTTTTAPIRFKEDMYQKVLKKIEERKTIFETPPQENSSHPFQ